MAKGRFRRARARTVAVASRARSGYRRARGTKVGRRFNFRKVMAGGATNVGARVGAQYLGAQWGPAAGAMAAGVLLNDDTSQWMAGYLLGNQVPLPAQMGGSGPQGGFF